MNLAQVKNLSFAVAHKAGGELAGTQDWSTELS